MYNSIEEYHDAIESKKKEDEMNGLVQQPKMSWEEERAYKRMIKQRRKRGKRMRENKDGLIMTFARVYGWAFSFAIMGFSFFFPILTIVTVPFFFYMTYKAWRPIIYKLLTPFRCVWRVCTYTWEKSGNVSYSGTLKRKVVYQKKWMRIVFGVFGRMVGALLIFLMWAAILFYRPYAGGVRLYTPSYEPGDFVVCETRLWPTNASKYMAVVISKSETGYICNANGVEKDIARGWIRGKYVGCNKLEGFLLSCKQVFVHIYDGAEILFEKYKESK